jgi:hypothetical protein
MKLYARLRGEIHEKNLFDKFYFYDPVFHSLKPGLWS